MSSSRSHWCPVKKLLQLKLKIDLFFILTYRVYFLKCKEAQQVKNVDETEKLALKFIIYFWKTLFHKRYVVTGHSPQEFKKEKSTLMNLLSCSFSTISHTILLDKMPSIYLDKKRAVICLSIALLPVLILTLLLFLLKCRMKFVPKLMVILFSGVFGQLL